jgi:hypothetical protein
MSGLVASAGEVPVPPSPTLVIEQSPTEARETPWGVTVRNQGCHGSLCAEVLILPGFVGRPTFMHLKMPLSLRAALRPRREGWCACTMRRPCGYCHSAAIHKCSTEGLR